VKDAKQWTFNLEKERSDLEKQVLTLRQELAQIKGKPIPEANDRYAPDFGNLYGGRDERKKTDRERS
jgi:hypothetical protein